MHPTWLSPQGFQNIVARIIIQSGIVTPSRGVPGRPCDVIEFRIGTRNQGERPNCRKTCRGQGYVCGRSASDSVCHSNGQRSLGKCLLVSNKLTEAMPCFTRANSSAI